MEGFSSLIIRIIVLQRNPPHNQEVQNLEWERHVVKMAQDHAAEQEWIEKMRQFQNKPAPVDFIPASPSMIPEMEHPDQLSGPKWEPPTPW